MIRVAVYMTGTAPRRLLVEALEQDDDITVVDQAEEAADALPAVTRLRPDLLLMELGADHRAAVRAAGAVMAHAPTPILMLSRRTADRDAPPVAAALVAGALEAIHLPETWSPERAAELRRVARQVSRARVIRHMRGGRPTPTERVVRGRDWPVVALAASTGGPAALASVLAQLGDLPAAVLVVQHLHPEFTNGFLEWLARASALPASVAVDGETAQPGNVYVAGAGAHLRLGPGRRLQLTERPVTLHRPSADELLGSVARNAGARSVGVVLTGMGDDGARGLLAMRQRGARTYGQDAASCAVFGMPSAADKLGAVEALVPLEQVAATVRRAVTALVGGMS